MSEPHLNPPVAKRVPMVHTEHGIERPDPYFWMRERDHPDVLDYLTAENQYLEHKMYPIPKADICITTGLKKGKNMPVTIESPSMEAKNNCS
jgi:protease II